MRSILALLAACVVLAVSAPARAAFHLYDIAEFFSSADGSVQFIRLHSPFGGQNFVAGQVVTCSDGNTTHTFTFDHNISSDTTNGDILIATANFTAVGGVTPDFTIEPGFLFINGGTLTFPPSFAGPINYSAMPTDGVTSLSAALTPQPNTPRNSFGMANTAGQVQVPPGACCVGSECSIRIQFSCTALDGTWTLGGTCASTPCTAPISGACCRGVLCSITTPAACTGTNTTFNGAPLCNPSGNNSSPCCRADFNHVNGLSIQDIFDYLNAWFAGSLTTDTENNGAGPLTIQSIFNFLNLWFAGC